MYGIGVAEVLVILVVAVLVFGGPAIIGFWLGYQAGKKAGDDSPSSGDETRQVELPERTKAQADE